MIEVSMPLECPRKNQTRKIVVMIKKLKLFVFTMNNPKKG